MASKKRRDPIQILVHNADEAGARVPKEMLNFGPPQNTKGHLQKTLCQLVSPQENVAV